MKRSILIIIVISLLSGGCYYDVEEYLYPDNGVCDTNSVTYSTTILPILQGQGCLGCHSGGAPSGNISLEGYNNVKTVALNGKLYGVINYEPGYSPMPQGGNKLSACNINRVKAWIDAGAPNN